MLAIVEVHTALMLKSSQSAGETALKRLALSPTRFKYKKRQPCKTGAYEISGGEGRSRTHRPQKRYGDILQACPTIHRNVAFDSLAPCTSSFLAVIPLLHRQNATTFLGQTPEHAIRYLKRRLVELLTEKLSSELR